MIYFNENDRHAAAWLGNLWPDATVDQRSITDVAASDVVRYRRCHFFAGIGGWEYALQLAGWPDDRPVWTGSCPCQPFSTAGRRKGKADERHLWPEFLRLIAELRPPVCFGEQVASRLGREWLAGVRADLEALGYAVGAADLCAAGLGAPHIRQRLFWVADGVGHGVRRNGPGAAGGATAGLQGTNGQRERFRADTGQRGLGDALRSGPQGITAPGSVQGRATGRTGDARGVEHPASDGRLEGRAGPVGRGTAARCRVDDLRFWDSFDLIPCRDEKVRRVEPGTFPLVDGVPGRVVKLRGYGNAIVPQMAAVFILAFLEATTTLTQPEQ